MKGENPGGTTASTTVQSLYYLNELVLHGLDKVCWAYFLRENRKVRITHSPCCWPPGYQWNFNSTHSRFTESSTPLLTLATEVTSRIVVVDRALLAGNKRVLCLWLLCPSQAWGVTVAFSLSQLVKAIPRNTQVVNSFHNYCFHFVWAALPSPDKHQVQDANSSCPLISQHKHLSH